MTFKLAKIGVWCAGAVLVLAAAVRGDAPATSQPDAMRQMFADPPAGARPMVRWWWFGPAVTQAEIGRELAAMRAGGFGGFELQTTYPLATGSDPTGVSNFKFLSPEHLGDIRFAAERAKAMGLRMDLTLGSGWPYGGATTPIEMAAGRLRVFAAPPPSTGPLQGVMAMPMLREGEELLAVEGGNAFVSSRTRMMVKRPAWGAEGFVVDHLDAGAVKHFLDTVAAPAVAACGTDVPHALFCDSLECYGEDWTPNFLAEFQRRRGYDLRPLLPALVGEADASKLEIRHDWGRTLTELFEDHFVKTVADFAHRHHSLFRIQAYGTPSAGLSSYLGADLPEGEGFQWHGFRETRYASSACHLMGVPVSSSETFTWIHPPVFRATPLDIKAEANLHFLQGVNQIICHGWPYSPPQAGEPGWSFYASGVFNDHNPWWGVMPEVTRYLARCSWMLRQGKPANDVLLYLANDDAWAHFTLGHVSLSDGVGKQLGPRIVGEILDGGYNLDFFDDAMLAARGRVDGDSIAFGDLRYKVVVLAGVERIPPATLATLEKFVDGGGILIATRSLPSIAPGHLATAADQAAVREGVQRLFRGEHPPALFVPDESKVAAAMATRLRPDVVLEKTSAASATEPTAASPTEPAPEIGFVHRRTPTQDIYFFANTSNQSVSFTAGLRESRVHVELWDPMQGTSSGGDNSVHQISLVLPPYGSMFVIASGAVLPPMTPNESEDYFFARGKPSGMDLSSDWTVRFGDAAPLQMHALHSWTDDAATRQFSGTAIYTREFAVPQLAPSRKVKLTFGDGKPLASHNTQRAGSGFAADFQPPVAEAAVVYVNGQRAGAVWCPPYSLDITRLLRPGENALRIEVSNTAVNELAGGKFPNYDYRGLVEEFGNRFQPARPAQFQPVPSGLLGPITLTRW